MKQPARVSPFAARTSQEQKEQWIVWQAQQNATHPVDEAASAPRLLPMEPPPEPQGQRPQPLHHGQYDAVLKRIAQAQRSAGAFVRTDRPNGG